MEISKLAWRDGFLCAVSSHTKYDEPVLVTTFWPLARMNQADAGEYEGREATYSGDPWYTYELVNDSGWHRPKWRLPEGGKTKAVAVDTTAIEKPKGRAEMRYYQGRWQKYLARSGWVNA